MSLKFPFQRDLLDKLNITGKFIEPSRLIYYILSHNTKNAMSCLKYLDDSIRAASYTFLGKIPQISGKFKDSAFDSLETIIRKFLTRRLFFHEEPQWRRGLELSHLYSVEKKSNLSAQYPGKQPITRTIHLLSTHTSCKDFKCINP